MAIDKVNLYTMPQVLFDRNTRRWTDRQVKVVGKTGAVVAAVSSGRVAAIGAQATGLGSLRPLFWAFNLKEDLPKLQRPTSYNGIVLLAKVCFEVTFVTSSALTLVNYFYPTTSLARAASLIGKPSGYFVAVVMAMEVGKYTLKTAKGETLSTPEKWDWAADTLDLFATGTLLIYSSRNAFITSSALGAAAGWCGLQEIANDPSKNPFST